MVCRHGMVASVEGLLSRTRFLPFFVAKTFIVLSRIMQLVKNFRSHPDILAFPNEQFYGNQLQACGDPLLTKSLENSDELPTKKFPIVFHSVVGRDQREESSPSFFNISEATLVKKYCASLIAKKGIRKYLFPR